MTTETIDIEATPTQTQALAVRGQNEAIGILRPADSLDRIAEAFKEYQQVCERILTPDDYQAYEGKPRKKKSAWRKLATAFNVSTFVVKEELERDDNRRILSASFTICAYIGPKDKPYRQFEAVGYCDINEKCCASSRGEDCHKRAWKGHFCCKDGCDGRKHWTHPDHDVRSTAQTRASNRAIADLIGCGEVSAEELSDEGTTPKTTRNAAGRSGGVSMSTQANKTAPTPTPVTPPAQKTPSSPKTITPKQAIFADDTTRARMIAQFQDSLDLATEYFQKAGCILPTEKLEDLPLQFVPVTRRQFEALQGAITGFGNGEEAMLPYPPNPEPEPAAKPATKPIQRTVNPFDGVKPQERVDKSPSVEAAKAKDPEWFFKVICPIPYKGQKRDAYLKQPDTILSLYRRMKEGDNEAQKRLWGFAKHWAPTERQVGNKVYQPSAEDLAFREALDAFCEWEEKHGKDTQQPELPAEEDDLRY